MELANAIRFLAVDAVEAANSGHPGMPLGMADIATVLWQNHLKHAPNHPAWINRDRFVLSNGHGSMLLYALLHLTGYDLSLAELRNFRQLDSKTPGHPELMPGVETTTGPLGQGLGNAVGMALAEQRLAKEMPGIIDHHTYVFVGDGCLMEGVSHEVASFAGHHKLGKLIVFWDDNSITIDGKTNLAVSDNVAQRFSAYGWQVISDVDGHNPAEIDQAIQTAKQNTSQPTLIACKTEIGFGSEVANTAKVHGSPLGADNVAKLRQKLNWPHAPFAVPEEIYQAWDAKAAGDELYLTWQKHLIDNPKASALLDERLNLDITFKSELTAAVDALPTEMATRKASNCFLNDFANRVPGLIGGSADLTPSVLTNWAEAGESHINYGVREFGMFTIMSGLSLHGGFLPFGGTFLTFLDYGRSAIRMAAIMQLRQIYVLTHDSIGLGEDGPTHQPVEHLSILRATPGLDTWRPADAFETYIAWYESLLAAKPSVLALSRQNLPRISQASHEQVAQGAYISWQPEVEASELHAIIIATGSELHLAVSAAKDLAANAINVRVVSMPCMERFLQQPVLLQQQILPPEIQRRLAVEASSSLSWWRFVGNDGIVLGIDRYGESAPAIDLFERFGFTVSNISDKIIQMMEIKCE